MAKEKLKTIEQEQVLPEDRDPKNYNFQPVLTQDLDQYKGEFTRDHFNRMVLWKVNRYVSISDEVLKCINEIEPEATERNDELTEKILDVLLRLHGVRLPMASTFLRFRNPKIYQIIDQRVYRFIYGEPLKLPNSKSDKAVAKMIRVYNNYLQKLDEVCKNNDIPFELSDRWLYQADLRVNKGVKINY